ncbi:MAG: endonuclease/exonuclease/phosphatase family protein [Candidatus Symbiothrix sp.]|jgi:endonuclease/exonuclease/phosphatase family metal-dependent hydrolase|nr:endonuclease/exonuclease/phosphatase family protein [Candidatus Symbiothrix sp.]
MPKNNAFIRLVWRLVTGIAVVGLCVLLLSAFSDRISPQTNRYIPFFGLFFPFILGFNVLFLVFWLFFHQWKQFFLTALVLLICGGAIHIYFPMHQRTQEVPKDCIKLLTYNVMHFSYKPKSKGQSILQYIKEQDPDIVCFQEFGGLKEADVRKALKATPYSRFIYPHLAVFSKYPILSAKSLYIPSEYNGSMMVELDVNGRKLSLINNHLESNKISSDEREEYYDLTKELDTHKLESFTHSMFKRLSPAYSQRAQQINLLSELIHQDTNPYLVMCGDFNDTPISYSHRVINQDLVDAFVESGKGMGISFNQHRFFFRIDYIFHSKNMKAYNCTVGKLKTSDHYPVWTYLQLKD